MVWGEIHKTGSGTSGQIEEAHIALDEVGVPPGPLASRASKAAAIIKKMREPKKSVVDL